MDRAISAISRRGRNVWIFLESPIEPRFTHTCLFHGISRDIFPIWNLVISVTALRMANWTYDVIPLISHYANGETCDCVIVLTFSWTASTLQRRREEIGEGEGRYTQVLRIVEFFHVLHKSRRFNCTFCNYLRTIFLLPHFFLYEPRVLALFRFECRKRRKVERWKRSAPHVRRLI